MPIKPLLVCAVLFAGAAAQAQDTRHTLDVGAVFSNQGDASIDGPFGSGVPPGASLDIGNATALLLRYEFLATPNIGLQLAAGIGGSFSVGGSGSIAALGTLFDADQLTVSGFVNYHFFEPTNALRPFLGLGFNYTSYSGLSASNGQSVDLSNTWGFAVQAGVRYAIDRNWSVAGTLGSSWGKSDLQLSDGTSTQTTRIDMRPVVVGLALGYSF